VRLSQLKDWNFWWNLIFCYGIVVAIETLVFLVAYKTLEDVFAFRFYSWDEIISLCIVPPIVEEYAKWYLINKRKWHWFFTALILTTMEGIIYGFIYAHISWAIWILMRRIYYYPIHILIARSYIEDSRYLPYGIFCHFLVNFGAMVNEPAWPISVILITFAFIPMPYVLLGCSLLPWTIIALRMTYSGAFIFVAIIGILVWRVWKWYKCLS